MEAEVRISKEYAMGEGYFLARCVTPFKGRWVNPIMIDGKFVDDVTEIDFKAGDEVACHSCRPEGMMVDAKSGKPIFLSWKSLANFVVVK